MADSVEYLPLEWVPSSTLKADPNNIRVHSERQVRQLKASIDAFGWSAPIICDEGWNIIAGHARRAASLLERAGKKWKALPDSTVPVLRIRGLTDLQIQALRIADNAIAPLADWDRAGLVSAMESLQAQGVHELVGVPLSILEARDGSPKIGAALRWQVLVDCHSEQELYSLMNRFKQEGLKCRPLIS